MIYKQSSIDIIGAVVASMTFPVQITNVVSVGTTHTLTVCDIFHAQAGFSVTIDGNAYLIEDIAAPDTIIVTGAAPITVASFMLYTPFYFHGTPIETNVELVQEKNASNKTLMIWFLENFTDIFFDDSEDTREREIRFRLFFLTQANHEQWKVDDAYHNAIEPMRRLMENFIEKLRSLPARFDLIDWEYEAINYAKFGVYISNKGMQKSLFADKLAGCELNLSLKINKLLDCEEDCIT
jgi:hypothetical protein